MKAQFNNFFTLLTILTLFVGQAWATDPTHDAPATVTTGGKTYIDAANTPGNAGDDAYINYGVMKMDSKKDDWAWFEYGGTWSKSNSSYSLPTGAVGFCTPGSNSSSEFYGKVNFNTSSKTTSITIYFTGTTEVGFIWKNNNTSNNRWIVYTLQELKASDGTNVGDPSVFDTHTSTSVQYNKFTSLDGTKYYKLVMSTTGASSSEFYGFTLKKYVAPATKYTVTYKSGEGTGSDVVDDDAKTVKTFADCSFTAPTGYEFKEWQDGSSNVVAEGATVSADMTLTAIYRLIPTKYAVTYELNGASGDAPTETDKAEGDVFNLAAAPSWAGHAFDGWLCSADAAVKAAGSSYTMTAANTTFTAQWHELDCKIYSLTGGIGSAEIVADESNAEINAASLVLKGSNAIIKLTPASGETFKAGDVLTISGTVGNTSKNFGVKISASANKGSGLGLASVAGTTNPMIATATLSADADYLYICRDGGTTQTLKTVEVHRSCAEGTAAGLNFATAEVNKLTTDAAFTNPLTNTNGLVLAGYKSSDAGVATVDFSTGAVTIVGAGSATISVNSAVQTKAGTLYAAGSASYTLTVAAPPTYTVTYDNNGGEGTMTDSNSPYAEGAEVTLLDNTFTAPSGYAWSAWAVTETVSGNPVAVSEGKFTMPGVAVTVTAQWQLISDFDVKFFQGYGEPDVQIGATQSISTGNYATPEADPSRSGYRFLGWSTDGTEANIVDVASYGITAATDFTAVWVQQFSVTFDGAGAVSVDNGATVASPNSPVMAGKVFQGWYNGESKYDFSAAVTGNLALESKWAVANPNHFYYTYNDDFHFDGVVYKTPDGKTKDPEAAEASNVALETNPYTLFSGTAGITSIIATNGIYDYKKAAGTKHITAYLKLKADDATSNVVFTIASGYTAVLKLKMNGYSSNATISLKKGDDAVTPSGTQEGTAEGKNYGELTYNLTAGEYKLTTANKTLYISHIDLEATALPTHTVTYKAGEGTGDDVVDADATNVADVPGSFTAPEGKIFNGWKDALDNDVAVGTIVENDMTLTAQWINHYAVTFNMNDHGDAIDPQDIKHGAKATKPADPVADGFDFGGWFTDNGTFEAPFDFNTPITAATPLYAKWIADPCPAPFSLSKVVLTSASDGTVTGYNGNEYAGEAVIGGLKDDDNTAEVDPSHEGVEEGYKLNGGGSGIVFATLKKGNFQEGDRVIVTITAKQNSYKIEEVSQDVLHIYYGTNASDATKLTTLESVSTAGSYTYRLKAADITAIGTKKGIGVFRESSNGQNPYVYSVEIKGCRSFAVMHTLTFKNIDGTATIAAEPLEEGAYASTVAPAAPKITMKRFLGWAEATDGTPVDLTTYTITENKTLYAVYEDIVCPTTGTVYKFQLKTDLTSGSIFTSAPGELTLNTTDHLSSMVNGEVTVNLASGKNTNRVQFYDGKAIGFANGDGASITLTLDCALATGDEIRFINYAGNGNKMNLSDGAHSLELNGNNAETVQKITVNSDWNGADELTLTRGGNTPKLTYFEIYRPAKYDVSFNMMGHGSAIADLTDVPEGSKIVAPDPAPTDVDYSFAGWYKENTLENEWDFDNDVVNAATTLYAKWLDKSDATLKSLKYGDEDITLVDGIYTYNISLPAFTSAVPALTAVPNNPNATAVPTNAAAFDGEGNATSTVLVTPESGTPQTYTVNFSKGVEVTLQDVTGSITWDFANAVSTTVNITGTPQVLANYGGVTNTVNVFESDKLEASGEKFTAGSKANLRARYIHFHTTVPGMLSISYSNTGGTNPARYIYVNGVKYDNDGSASTTPKGIENKVFVPAGDVYLEMKDGNDAPQNIQVYKIIFNDQADYTRNVTEGRYGTICLPNGGVMVGAELYEVAYLDNSDPYQKIFLDEVPNGEMVAGRPYVFLPNEGASQLGVFYTGTDAASAGNYRGLYGSYTKEELPTDGSCYILLNNQYRQVVESPTYVGANKAYFLYSQLPTTAIAPKPGIKRVGLGVAAPQTPTDVDNLNATDAPVKVMINGQMYIIRGEKMYNANGQLVK